MNKKYIKEDFLGSMHRLYPQEKNKIRTITFQVTDNCNLACTYCYQHNKKNHIMNIEIAKSFIDIILANNNEYINLNNTDGVILDFIGGEPLLAIDTIEQIVEYFLSQMIELDHPWQNKIRFSICSNGVLYFSEKFQTFLKKYNDLLSFSISIDGNKELHDSCRIFPDGNGSYDIAIAAVNHYRKNYDNFIGSKMTLAPNNIQYTFQAVKSLIENGYTDINLNCIFEEGWNYKDATILYYELKKISEYLFKNNLQDKIYLSIFNEQFFMPMPEENNENWCGGTGAMLAVDYKGDIYPCLRYMESSIGDKQKPLIIGNVSHGILCTEDEKFCNNCISNITRKSQSTEECFNCPIAAGCAWCSAYNYEVFGTVNKRTTFICPMHKATALANYYFWNKYHILNNDEQRKKIYIPEDWALQIIDEQEWKNLKEMEKMQ